MLFPCLLNFVQITCPPSRIAVGAGASTFQWLLHCRLIVVRIFVNNSLWFCRRRFCRILFGHLQPWILERLEDFLILWEIEYIFMIIMRSDISRRNIWLRSTRAKWVLFYIIKWFNLLIWVLFNPIEKCFIHVFAIYVLLFLLRHNHRRWARRVTIGIIVIVRSIHFHW